MQCSQCFLFAVGLLAHSAPVETDRTVIGDDVPQATDAVQPSQWNSAHTVKLGPLGTFFFNHLTVQSVVDDVKSLFNENFSMRSVIRAIFLHEAEIITI